MGVQLPVFLCPSDSGSPTLPSNNSSLGISASSAVHGAKTTYDFSTNPGNEIYNVNSWRTATSSTRSMFGVNSDCRIASITDGTSSTMAIAETTLEQESAPHAWGYRGFLMSGVSPVQALNYPPGGVAINNWHQGWGTSSFPAGKLGGYGWMGSLHPGGAQMAAADGSVHFLAESTNIVTLQRLSWIADGKALGVFE